MTVKNCDGKGEGGGWVTHLGKSCVVESTIEPHAGGEHAKNLFTGRAVGHAQANLALKTAGASQRRVKGIRSVCCTNHDDRATRRTRGRVFLRRWRGRGNISTDRRFVTRLRPIRIFSCVILC